jgi:hypothetical protein
MTFFIITSIRLKITLDIPVSSKKKGQISGEGTALELKTGEPIIQA